MHGTLLASWPILFVFFRLTVSPMSVHAEAKRSMRLRRASFRPNNQALYFYDLVNSIKYGKRLQCIVFYVFLYLFSKFEYLKFLCHILSRCFIMSMCQKQKSPLFYTVLSTIWQSSLPSLTELSSLFDRFNSHILYRVLSSILQIYLPYFFRVITPILHSYLPLVISPIWQICRSYFLTEFSQLFNRVLSPIWQSALPYFIQSFLSYLTDLQR